MKKNVKIYSVIVLIAAVLGFFVYHGIPAWHSKRTLITLTAADMAQADKYYYGGIKAIGMVNSDPFFQHDLDIFAAERRAAVAAHFGRIYNLHTMGAKFWQTDFDGQTPQQFLNNLALEDLVRRIVLLQEARKRGIDVPDLFHDFEAEREIWNAPTDDIIFGPKTLNPKEFINYRITGISNALKTVFLANELKPTAAQLRKTFNSLDEGQKKAPVIMSLCWFYWDENKEFSNDTIRLLLEQGLNNGEDSDTLVNRLSGKIPGLEKDEFILHNRLVSREDPYEQELWENLLEVGIGSLVSGPVDRPEAFLLLNREGGHIMSFEEAPGLARNKWINDQFELFLDKKTEEARVTLFI